MITLAADLDLWEKPKLGKVSLNGLGQEMFSENIKIAEEFLNERFKK